MLKDIQTKAKLLYDQKDYKEALKLYEVIKKADEEYIQNSCMFHYLWCLYHVKINEKDAFSNEKFAHTKETIKYILRHQTNADLLYQLTVFKVMKHYKGKQFFEAMKINGWLDRLDPSLLSNSTYMINVNGKEIEQQSKREEWYSLKSKVYEKLERYDECISISEEALTSFKPLHNNNEIWFKRRIAICNAKLGNTDEAISVLNELLRFRKDWYIYNDLSRIYLTLHHDQEALHSAFNAILRPGEDNKKINLFWNTGNCLEKLGRKEGELFKEYVLKIKLSNNWKLSREEESFYKAHIQIIENVAIEKMKKQILHIANEHKWKDKEHLKGKILKILPNNKAGFIIGEKGSYYFSFNEVRVKKDLIQKDKKVMFYVEEYYNENKKEMRYNAVNITLVE